MEHVLGTLDGLVKATCIKNPLSSLMRVLASGQFARGYGRARTLTRLQQVTLEKGDFARQCSLKLLKMGDLGEVFGGSDSGVNVIANLQKLSNHLAGDIARGTGDDSDACHAFCEDLKRARIRLQTDSQKPSDIVAVLPLGGHRLSEWQRLAVKGICPPDSPVCIHDVRNQRKRLITLLVTPALRS